MKYAKVKITNQALFEKLVESVDISSLKSEGGDMFDGGIYIYTSRGTVIPFYGLIIGDDFEKEYGFILETD